MTRVCVYLADEAEIGEVRQCSIHGHCKTEGETGRRTKACRNCADFLSFDDPNFAEKFRDPLVVLTRRREQTHALRGLLAGRSVFLVGGGPSANKEPLEQLNRRGVWSLCVNNVAGHPKFRPQAFVCSDPPSKFHHGIWLDPAVIKFVPKPKLSGGRGKLREKTANGEFRPLIGTNGKPVSTPDCPNVWGFERRGWLKPDATFFTEKSAAWGNLNAGVQRTGLKKTVCTMLLGIRLLYYLGARRIFLLGVDFTMDIGRGASGNYSFGERRNEDAVASNNRQFAVVNEWLCEMQCKKVFGIFGQELYNTYAKSGLRAFPYVPFDEALADATVGIPSEPFDLEKWYEK